MLFRFSLYGFLKNQQYYEPFLVLAFLQMGLSYTLIGLLIAFREMTVNLMEIPTGAIADLAGRRKSMILSFASYIVHFVLMGATGLAAVRWRIGAGGLVPLLLVSMAFFAVGDAFRRGTHKGLFFSWLRLQGREHERTRVYGYTRSWSKIGSAVSVALACVFVFATRSFITVFFFSIIPYLFNIINFLGYPKEVEGEQEGKTSLKEIALHLREALLVSARQQSLRRLMLESMGFEGFFKATKDYLQPILKAAALPLTALLFAGAAFTDEQRAVFLIGPVYIALFLLSAWASRKSHVLAGRFGNEDRAARFLWGFVFVILAVMVPAMVLGVHWAMILGFVALYIMQNLWRPVLISRFGAHSDDASGATILSIESQAKSVAAMIIAPLMGYAVDAVKYRGIGGSPFWPVAVFGAAVSFLFFLSARSEKSGPESMRDSS